MAPPVALILLGVAATAGTAYIIKESWEPHIKPRLQKAGTAVSSFWKDKTRRKARPVGAASSTAHGQGGKDGRRSSHDDDPSGAPTLNILSDTAEWQGSASGLRLRKTHISGPPPDLEMMELEKSNAFISHVPLTPTRMVSQSGASQGTPRGLSLPNPFADPSPRPREPFVPLRNIGLMSPPASDHGRRQLSSPPAIHVHPLGPPPLDNAINTTYVPPADEFFTRSPFSDALSMSASAFSWQDGAGSQSGAEDHLFHEVDPPRPTFSVADSEEVGGSVTRSDTEDDEDLNQHGSDSEESEVESAASGESWESVASPSTSSDERGRR